ncbi:MAG: zinc dependent phospholipase C family protein, partial [Gammaproteobacteria bacterium]
MLKKSISLALLLTSIFIYQFCDAGSVTHMFIAKETIAKLQDKELANLLLNNMDAYLVGSNYPDTGFIRGTHYGNASHWETFINTFVIYLREKYPFPDQQNPKLVAFVLGCAAHDISDQVFHGTFLNTVAMNDFKGNWNKAHQQSETALDLLITVEKNQWGVRPSMWWVPMSDLLAVYHRMGSNQFSLAEIFWGNTVYSFAGISERAVSPFAYGYIRLKMPWLAHH